MFDIWFDAARTHQPLLSLPLAAIERSQAIVLGALGTSWIDVQAARMGLPERDLHDVHPLYRALTGATVEGILEVCELAGYLMAFREDSDLRLLIADLRDHGKYESAFFEAAIAWRWRDAGFPVELRPRTPSGVADLGCNVDGLRAIMELSGFPSNIFSRPAMVAATVVSRTVSRLTRRLNLPFLLGVEVTIEDETEGNFQQDLATSVAHAVRNFATTCGGDRIGTVNVAPFGSVTVRPARTNEGPSADGASISARTLRIPRPAIGTLHNIQHQPGSGDAHWIHVRFDDSPVNQQRRLASKLKKENQQLSGVSDPRIIILDVSGLGLGVVSEGDPDTAETLTRFDRNHASVSQVWLLTRVWSTEPARWIYRGQAHPNPNANRPLPADLGYRVAIDDRDVLRSLAGT
jgi:hypothetical protein